MRILNIASVLAALLAAAACGPAQTDITIAIEPGAEKQLQGLPGQIGITIQNAAQVHRVLLEKGVLKDAPHLPRAEEKASAMGAGPYGATEILDNASDYYVRGPYLISPDRKVLAASVELKDVAVASSTGYVIAELGSKRVVSISRSKTQGVSGLAWSPDSKFLAVLRHEQVRVGRTPLELLSSFSGHPVQYVVYSLEVVDRSGNLIATSRLTNDITGTWGEMVWL
jgi:hypothetical protein